MISTTNASGKLSTEGIVFGGASAHVGAGGVNAGIVGFKSGAGVYVDGHAFGVGGGVGAYLNITTNAGCRGGKK